VKPSEIETALHAMCELAAVETLSRFRAPIEITNKLDAGFDPVTLADKAAEAAIRSYIIENYRDHGILGEEEAPRNQGAEFNWIIDPIDGTRAFISGLPTWGTLIGLSQNEVPIGGVMHQPFIGEKYFATTNGAFLEHNGHVTPIQSSKQSALSQATLMSTAPELFAGSDEEAFQALSDKCRLTRFGFDCYAYAMVAAGHVELVVECGLNAYDIAPLIPIIENAGGIVRSWDGSSAANGGRVIAAANETLLNQALETLNSANFR